MNKLIGLIILAFTLFAVNAFAWTAPASPKPQSAILDQSGVLSTSAKNRLDNKLNKINSNSANEIAILILPSLDGESIEDVAHTTAKTWGVGKSGLDNGVLIVLAMKERKSRIETGKGVEGDLPDLKCNDILQNVLKPRMKNGDVEGALNASVDAIANSIANNKFAVSHTPNRSTSCDVVNVGSNGESKLLWVGGVSILLAVFFVILMRRADRKKRELVQARLDELKAESKKLQSEKLKNDLKKIKEAAPLMKDTFVKSTVAKPVFLQPKFVPSTIVDKSIMPSVKHIVTKTVSNVSSATMSAVAVAASATLLADQEERRHQERRRKEREEGDAGRRRYEESASNFSSFSSSSSSSSSPSSSDSGSSFGGGDFSGSGSSNDW